MKVAQAAFPHSKQLTAETAAVYLSEWAEIIREVGQEGFELALTAAIREVEFFPSIAVIRRYAGANTEKKSKIEGEQAWEWVQNYNRRWHNIPGGRVLRGRDKNTGELLFQYPPEIPERIEYAMRSVGGLGAIARVDDRGYPFMKKEFIEAFDNWRFVAMSTLELPVQDALKQLTTELIPVNEWAPTIKPQPLVRHMPRPLTDEEEDARRCELKRQARELMKDEGQPVTKDFGTKVMQCNLTLPGKFVTNQSEHEN